MKEYEVRISDWTSDVCSRSHFAAQSGTALLRRSGRRWRAAPDEGASLASCSCGFGRRSKGRLAALAPLIRPPGTFSREREKGYIPAPPHHPKTSLLLRSENQPFSCAAGEGLASVMSCRAVRISPSPAQREKG